MTIKNKQPTKSLLVMGIIIGILTTLTFQQIFIKSDIQKAKEAITSKYLAASSTACKDPSDPTKPQDRVAVFAKYLKVNSLANRAVIRGCNDIDHLLAKTPSGNWVMTYVQMSLDTRANPIWQKACLIQDITTTDTVVRPENSSIDEFNLQACKALDKLRVLDIFGVDTQNQ